MGHQLEDCCRSQGLVLGSQARKQNASGKKPKWKDTDEELEGVPKDILEERWKGGKCQKCGGAGHKWFACKRKAPVTKRDADSDRKKAKL